MIDILKVGHDVELKGEISLGKMGPFAEHGPCGAHLEIMLSSQPLHP